MEHEYLNFLLSAKEVSKVLKVNLNRVHEYANEGLLPFVITPPSSARKFRVTDVNRFIAGLTNGEG